MLFVEPIFLFVFLPILLGAHWLLPARFRNSLLLAASLLFYFWGELGWTLLLLASVILNYCFGILISRSEAVPARRWSLAIGIVLNLGVLFCFKYAEFFLGELWRWEGIRLPLGISFFTFQSMSYLIDVCQGSAKAQRRFRDLALYIGFFPQLIAGPIVRYQEIVNQLASRSISMLSFQRGVNQFIVGLGKKMILANAFAFPADQLMDASPADLNGSLAWFGVLCYSFQIYFDFSGYSDMAIGLGRMFGFRFPANFQFPYAACSVTQFWKRWHMTLGRWLRDYLYIPLGGNRVGRLRSYLNLGIVFLLCGLWHGASWNFVCWGMFHGSLLIGERLWSFSIDRRSFRILGRVYLWFVVIHSWVLFRTSSIDAAVDYWAVMFGLFEGGGTNLSIGYYMSYYSALVFFLGLVGVFPIRSFFREQFVQIVRAKRKSARLSVLKLGHAVSIGFHCIVFLWSLMEIASGTYNPFIYFRF